MTDIKIFVTHTPDSHKMRISNPLFYHVTAGSDFQKGKLAQDMMADNTGDNISFKNKSYCELTTQYWAWKNVEAEYYGFCHYRRYFSFSSENMPEADFGCLFFPYANEKTIRKLCMDETSIRQKVCQYDCLIAKKIPVRKLLADSVYDHYRRAPELKIKDLELFQEIVSDQYPQLRETAERYIQGKYFYPCNMFIMKKEIFQEYAQMLFAVLEEFERRADVAGYSREAIRTPGHLGERFAGIYYEYLMQKGGYRLTELQMAMFEHTKAETYQLPEAKEIPVVFAANEEYVPVLFICMKSVADHANENRNYHFYVFHTDIEEKQMRVFEEELVKGHIQIDFIDVGEKVAGYRLQAKEHISKETYYRFLILDFLKDCRKVVYLDSDLIVCRDIAQLYDIPMEDCLLAAAVDPDFSGQYNGANPDAKSYCDQTLELKNPFAYAQAGVLVFAVAALNRVTSVQKLFRMADEGNYRYSDQDILNIVCEGRIKKLDMVWNMLINSRNRRYQIIRFAPANILEEYEQARKHPAIIHYAGDSKPWNNPKEDFAWEFWKTARQTPYYEQLLCGLSPVQEEKRMAIWTVFEWMRRIAKKCLPKGSRIRQTASRIYWSMK